MLGRYPSSCVVRPDSWHCVWVGALNSDAGYGWVTKLLHWLTAVALAGQFLLGYAMEELSEGLTDGDGEDVLVFVHGWVGGGILALAVLRVLWRLATPLPPWSPRLSGRDRVLQTWTERALLTLLFLTPGTGLALLFLSGAERETGKDAEWQPPYDLVEDDALLTAHVCCHIAFYVTLAMHIGLVLRRRTLTRMA
jgi:cytochrome b561